VTCCIKMSVPNRSVSHPPFFILVGIPGMEKSHPWISIPVCVMYAAALLGNSVLLVNVGRERRLHEPVYLLLCLLAVYDLLLTTTTVPKTLGILWSLSTHISSSACLVQMFSIYFVFMAESAVLVAMAFDHYVAMCDPLHYAAVLTRSAGGKVILAALIRSSCIMFPAIFLLERLPYCGHNVMAHTYCEHIDVACADISLNIWYGAAAGVLSAGLDLVCIAVSYALILRCLWGLPAPRACPKALHTCGSHLSIIATFYTPAFSTLVQRFGQHVPRHVLVTMANLYVVVPPMLKPVVYRVRTRLLRECLAHLL
ncbi:O52B2 protein, partial [Sapayoa aenigma]|nr:O52B2 protein [Sapayoa aenigma]